MEPLIVRHCDTARQTGIFEDKKLLIGNAVLVNVVGISRAKHHHFNLIRFILGNWKMIKCLFIAIVLHLILSSRAILRRN